MPLLTLHSPAHTSRTIAILIEEHASSRIKEMIPGANAYDKAVILYDHAVKHRAQAVALSWKNTVLVEVQSGEHSKSLREVERVTRALLEARVTRQSLLIVIGGGVLTDLGGFVASIYMRGIDFVLAPTSFLAMVDAAIGGKTGIDLDTSKNILGSFSHPRTIICDIDALATLPDEGLCEGLVEVIKMAAMLDANVFTWLEGNIDAILRRDPVSLTSCIERAVQMKISIVQEDEAEKNGKRQLLNFGHTIGHALEAISNFQLSHGKAVSIGMAAEMAIATTPDAARVLSLLKRIRMPTEFPRGFVKEEIWKTMQSDKKASGGILHIAVPLKIGSDCVQTLTKEKFFQAFR